MKALYVLHRIFHYFAIWFFIIGGAAVAYGLWATNGAGLGFYGLVFMGIAILCMMLSHIFRMSRKLVKKSHQKECCCCKKECEAPASDLDEQVEEIMKWKNLYVEGIITEREFIDKRNEILRLSK